MNVVDLLESARGAALRIEVEHDNQRRIFGSLARILSLPSAEHISFDDGAWHEQGSDVIVLHDGRWTPTGQRLHARHPEHGVVVTVGDGMTTGVVRMIVDLYTVRLLDRECVDDGAGMTLNAYDTESDNPLNSRVTMLDLDYQAEQWIIEMHAEPSATDPARWVVRYELVDALGVRARWERPDGDASMPKLTHAEPRFLGVRPPSAPAEP